MVKKDTGGLIKKLKFAPVTSDLKTLILLFIKFSVLSTTKIIQSHASGFVPQEHQESSLTRSLILFLSTQVCTGSKFNSVHPLDTPNMAMSSKMEDKKKEAQFLSKPANRKIEEIEEIMQRLNRLCGRE